MFKRSMNPIFVEEEQGDWNRKQNTVSRFFVGLLLSCATVGLVLLVVY